MNDIIRFTNGDDGVFAHVSTPEGKHYGVNVDHLADGDDLVNKFFAAVADRVRAGEPEPQCCGKCGSEPDAKDEKIKALEIELHNAKVEWGVLSEELRDAEKSADTEAKLTAIVKAFVEKQRISCPETIHQTDRVIENAYGLIEDLCDVVGYYDYPEDEA